MQALKGLVVGLGILIVISFGLLIYGFYSKLISLDDEAPAPSSQAASPAAAPPVPLAGFGEVSVQLPSGCTVRDVRPDGAGRLYLRLGPDETCDRILVVEVQSGRQLGVITLRP
jgi:hypothetical protein